MIEVALRYCGTGSPEPSGFGFTDLRYASPRLEVNIMFKWMQMRRPRRKFESVAEPPEAERDSGDEEYESHEEDAREAAPSGMTRVKTDKL